MGKHFLIALAIFGSCTPAPAADFRKLLDDLKRLDEPAKGRLNTLPDSIKILESVKKDLADTVAVRTYSNKLNEKALVEKYGKPDRTGKFGEYKTLQYDWLEFAVNAKGEICLAIRTLNPKKQGEFQSTITIEEKLGK